MANQHVWPNRSRPWEDKEDYLRFRAKFSRVAAGYKTGGLFSFSRLDNVHEEAEAITAKSLLRTDMNTAAKSMYERLFKAALRTYRCSILFEPIALPVVSKGHDPRCTIDSYVPDFLMPFHYINGKAIVIEPHSSERITFAYLKRLRQVRECYGLYIVLATTEHFRLHFIDMERVYEHIDEFWYVESTFDNGTRAICDNMDMLLSAAVERPENKIEDIIERLLEMTQKRQGKDKA